MNIFRTLNEKFISAVDSRDWVSAALIVSQFESKDVIRQRASMLLSAALLEKDFNPAKQVVIEYFKNDAYPRVMNFYVDRLYKEEGILGLQELYEQCSISGRLQQAATYSIVHYLDTDSISEVLKVFPSAATSSELGSSLLTILAKKSCFSSAVELADKMALKDVPITNWASKQLVASLIESQMYEEAIDWIFHLICVGNEFVPVAKVIGGLIKNDELQLAIEFVRSLNDAGVQIEYSEVRPLLNRLEERCDLYAYDYVERLVRTSAPLFMEVV